MYLWRPPHAASYKVGHELEVIRELEATVPLAVMQAWQSMHHMSLALIVCYGDCQLATWRHGWQWPSGSAAAAAVALAWSSDLAHHPDSAAVPQY
jgi:hypothetical protein